MSRLLVSILIVLSSGAAASAAVPAQDPGLPPGVPAEDPRTRSAPPPPNFSNKVHVKIEQAVDQEDPILRRSMHPKFYTQDNGNEVFIDATTLYRMPERRPEVTTPIFSLRASKLKFSTFGASGIANRFDPGMTQPPPDQDPPPPPPIDDEDPIPGPTKPLLVSGSGVSDSDSPFIQGPEIDLSILDNLDQWRSLRWLPEGSSLHVFGRLQFGTLELFDERTKIEMYAVGPRLALPFHRGESFELDATIFAGAAFVKTGLGEAIGFDGGAGVSAQQKLGAGVSLYGAIEAELFLAKGTSAFGPAFNIGLKMGF